MSRVTEFPDDEERPLQETPRRRDRDGGDEGGRLSRLKTLSPGGRLSELYQGVKQELAKTSWPTRTEVWSTTLVVLIAIVFFGFYLWGVDWLVTIGFEALEKAIR